MSRRGVQEALRRLEEDGHIVKTGETKAGTSVWTVSGVEPGENLGDSGDKGAQMAAGGAQMATPRGEVTAPDPGKDPRKDPSVRETVEEAWGKLAPPLIRHPAAMFRTNRFKTALDAALRVYDGPAITKAIENYAAIIESKHHYWNHRYSVVEFLNRPSAEAGVHRFVDEALPFENFRVARDRDRDQDGKTQRSPAEQLTAAEAWILNTAWKLPYEEFELAEELGRRSIEGPDRTRLLDLWREKREARAA